MPDQKRTSDLDWEDVRYFVALARHCTLSATARALRVNHATVSRRVGSLEAMLGSRLFDRGIDGYVLTRVGTSLLEDATVMEVAAAAVVRRRDERRELSGLVRLTAGRTLIEWFLVDHLREMHQRHPAIDIEIVGDARLLSLARREADVALRFGVPQNSDLVARRVGTVYFGLYVAAALQSRPDEAARLPLIGFDREEIPIAEGEWLEKYASGRRFAFRGSQAAQAAAARAGFGIALLPRYLADDDPRLAELKCDEKLVEREVWLLVRPELRKIGRIRAVVESLTDVFRDQQSRFGRLPERGRR